MNKTKTFEVWDIGYNEIIEAADIDAAIDEAKKIFGDPDDIDGDDGARIIVHIVELAENGDYIDETRMDLEIDIEPNHEALIRQAAGDAEVCGYSPDDHDWTSEGEGGCDENPGVWSVGGTAMRYQTHCRKCGLRRVEITTGTQYNLGEHDTVAYSMPDLIAD